MLTGNVTFKHLSYTARPHFLHCTGNKEQIQEILWVSSPLIFPCTASDPPIHRLLMVGIGTFFLGIIDDVRIYEKALTAEEIAVLAQ